MELRSASPSGEPGVAARRLEATRCHSCKKLLCESTRDAIRPGQVVAIKCGRCNAMNYLMGPTDVDA